MLVLIGESGVGKTTIEDKLISEFGFTRAVSFTTREPREHDVDGVNYYFVSMEELNTLDTKGELAERIDFDGNSYALHRNECVNDRVVTVAPEGLYQLLEKKDLQLVSVYLRASEATREARMLGRGDSVEKVKQRIVHDRKVFEGIAEKVNYVLDNDLKSLEEVVSEILSLV